MFYNLIIRIATISSTLPWLYTSAILANDTTYSNTQVLHHLLSAELASSRHLDKDALNSYLEASRLSQDPSIAKIATELALKENNAKAAIEASSIWANNALDDLQAQLIALSLNLGNQKKEHAKKYLSNAVAINSQAIEENLVVILVSIDVEHRIALTSLIDEAANDNQNNKLLQLCAASIYANQLDTKTAKTFLNRALKLDPKYIPAIKLNAKLIKHDLNSDNLAIEYLNGELKKINSNELREFVALSLADSGNEDNAAREFKILAKDPQYAPEALLKLGDYYVEKQDFNTAHNYLNMAIKYPQSEQAARFGIAQIYEYKDQLANAADYYDKVDSTCHLHVTAKLRAASLYYTLNDLTKALDALATAQPTTFDEQKQILLTMIDLQIESELYDEALKLNNQILEHAPGDIEFTYARSMINTKLNQYKDAEKDLKTVLAADPDNISALNSLAFVLSNDKTRINDALVYIEKALHLVPDHPAFLDSKGWILYLKGEINDAIKLIATAYSHTDEDIVAAHYGEVLWKNGEKDKAIKIWQKSIKSNAKHGKTKETMQKFAPANLNQPKIDLVQK